MFFFGGTHMEKTMRQLWEIKLWENYMGNDNYGKTMGIKHGKHMDKMMNILILPFN